MKGVDNRLKAVIIGCGKVAGGYDEGRPGSAIQTHAKAYQTNDRVVLTAACDSDKTKADRFCRAWGGLTSYGDVGEMLRQETPALVSICVPDETHGDVLGRCLGQPSIKAVWCEKPLAVDVRAAEQLVEAYREAGITLVVNYQRRWDPAMETVERDLRAGALGPIQGVVVHYTKGVCHNGSHAVDLLLKWFGSLETFLVLDALNDFSPADPTVSAFLRIGGVPVQLVACNERHYSIFEIDILGSRERLRVVDFGARIERQIRDTSGAAACLSVSREVVESGLATAMGAAVREIVSAVERGTPVRSTGETALVTLRVCRALADAARDLV